tara:strand:- start:219 stop:446 length:228 start_codon:yes stop_codon:yes gene_type:complete
LFVYKLFLSGFGHYKATVRDVYDRERATEKIEEAEKKKKKPVEGEGEDPSKEKKEGKEGEEEELSSFVGLPSTSW